VYIETEKVAYFVIPKNACTSIEAAMGGKRVQKTSKPVFTFIREPHDRIVSCWCQKLRDTKDGFKLGLPDLGFEDFVLWVCNNIGIVDHHAGLQSKIAPKNAALYRLGIFVLFGET